MKTGRRTIALSALALALVIFVADQAIKRVVENSMELGQSIPVIRDVLHLTYITNSGGAFGILSGSQPVLLVGSVIAIAVVLWMLLAGPPSKLTALGCGLVLGGAAGNLLDRLVAGAVIDYLDIRVWPIFNLADTAIVIGVGMLLVASFREPGAGDHDKVVNDGARTDP